MRLCRPVAEGRGGGTTRGPDPEARVDGGTEPIVDADHATQTWNALTEQVQAFIRAWETGPAPPDPGAFVPTEPAACGGCSSSNS